jgi:hypothetical protein
MNFLDNIDEQEPKVLAKQPSVYDQHETSQVTQLTHHTFDYNGAGPVSSRDIDRKMKEKVIELELEREEQGKALELLNQLRHKEREALDARVTQAKEAGTKQADEIKADMAERIEKQMKMIEDLLSDKRALSQKVEDVIDEMKDQHHQVDQQRKIDHDNFKVELKKNKDAWQAADKVRREKWEKEKIGEIRA